MLELNNLRPPKGANKKKFRVGRGPGSGNGVTAGRGNNGQKARSGYSAKPGFEGGQMPLHRRLPKRGFSNVKFQTLYTIINLRDLNEMEGDEFTMTQFFAKFSQVESGGIKVLGDGEINRAITVECQKISKSAKEKIEKAGGKVEVLGK